MKNRTMIKALPIVLVLVISSLLFAVLMLRNHMNYGTDSSDVSFCSTSLGQEYNSRKTNRFMIEGALKDIGDYSKTEQNFLESFEKNHTGKYELYDASELTAQKLEHRNGIIIIERCISVVTHNEHGNEHGIILNAYDPEYNYIGYQSAEIKEHIKQGTVLISYMIYNPNNNSVDDISERYDFVVCRQYEH